MAATIHKLRPKRFAHELILDQPRKGRHKGYCRCGTQSKSASTTSEVLDWYRAHLSKYGIREQKRREIDE